MWGAWAELSSGVLKKDIMYKNTKNNINNKQNNSNVINAKNIEFINCFKMNTDVTKHQIAGRECHLPM